MLESLLDGTREIIASVEKETGFPLQIVPSKGPYLSSALISAHERNGEPGQILIAYNPAASSVDYAIAHEIGRFLRYLRVPPESRVVLASDDNTRRRAYRAMQDDIAGHSGTMRSFIERGFCFFYDGILTQLVSTPADFWINQWLYDSYRDLRGEQRKGLDEIFQRAHAGYSQEIESTAPTTIYKANHAMNAALAHFVGGLMHTSRYSKPYRKSEFQKLGKRLYDLNPSDKGYLGDMEVTDRWAEVLGVKGWYVWKKTNGHA